MKKHITTDLGAMLKRKLAHLRGEDDIRKMRERQNLAAVWGSQVVAFDPKRKRAIAK